MTLTFDGRDLHFAHSTRRTPEVKGVLGGRWDRHTRTWCLAPTSQNVLTLVKWYGPGLLEDVPQEVRDLAEQPWGFRGFTDEERAAAEAHPAWAKLYDFQREGVEWLFCNPHAAGLCALSWGMGKGAVSCVTADLLGAKKVLVLAPLTLAPAWIDEMDKWTEGRNVHRASAKDRAPGPEVTIANHEVVQEVVLRDEDGQILEVDWSRNARKVKEWRDLGPVKQLPNGKMVPARDRLVRVRRDYLEVEWDLIIVDESVLLKNRKAVKFDVLRELRKKGSAIFLLSGSPITRYRDDLWSQMNVLFPRGFTSYWKFAEFFCTVDKGGWGWTIEGDSPENDPQSLLRDLLWVKSQDEALPDLPEYIEQHIPLEPLPAQAKALKSMLEDWIVELEDHPDGKVEASNWLSRNTRMQQITSNMITLPGVEKSASVKEDCLLELIERGEIETPLLVWTWYVNTTKSVYDRLTRKFPDLKVGYATGALTPAQKDEAIQAYKSGALDVLVLQMGTGKFGLTFTNTRTVYYHDRSFDSDAYVQSLARVRRIGLKHRPVLIVPKVLESSDQLIDLNLEGKLGNMARLTNADLIRLLRSIRP